MATVMQTENEARNIVPISEARDNYTIMRDKAKNFALSSLIPDSVKGKNADEAFANCLIALELANLMNEAPLVVMQNIHIVKGKAGFSAQYMIARANSSGVFKGRINWRESGSGNSLSVTAFAHLAETGEEVSFTCDMAMAKAENWTSNPKYNSMGPLMLRYRSATFLIRLYAPDVMLGYQTAEEHDDMLAAAGPSASTSPLTAANLMEQAKPETEAEVVETVAVENPAAAEGRTDDQHDASYSIFDWGYRLEQAQLIGDVITVEQEFDAAKAELSEDDYRNVTAWIAAAKARFGK